MSTRSMIAKQNEDGTYTAVYCHFDGFLENNGAILALNYTTPEKVDRLLSFGSMSVLAKNIDPALGSPHSFDYGERQGDVCVFYGRDRGETGTEADTYFTLSELEKESYCDYFYIFTPNGEWKYFKNGHSNQLRDVKEDLEKLHQCYENNEEDSVSINLS